MKFKKLQEMDASGLEKKETEITKELIKLTGAVSTGSAPKNAGQIKAHKKDIARILTLRRQREVKRNG